MSIRSAVAWAGVLAALCTVALPVHAMVWSTTPGLPASALFPTVARSNHDAPEGVRATALESAPAAVSLATPRSLTFAMVMLADPSAPDVAVGSVYAVTATNPAAATLTVNGRSVTVPRASIRELSVPAGTRSPMKRIHGRIVLGYDMGNAARLTADALDPVSVVSPLAFVLSNANGSLQGTLVDAEIATATAAGAQVWPIVQSGFNPARTNAFLSSPAACFTALSQVVAIEQHQGVSGVNLDFEDMQPNDAPLLTRFATGVSTVLHAMGKWVSVDVTPPSPDPHWGIVYDRAALARVADYIAVMTYDEHFPGSPAGSVSSIPWMTKSIQDTVAAGVPASKILVGVPFYTRSWDKQGGRLQTTELPLTTALSYQLIPGAVERWSSVQQQNVLTYTQDGISYTIWLENAASLKRRGALVRSAGLAGAAIWDLSQGAPQYIQDLVQSF